MTSKRLFMLLCTAIILMGGLSVGSVVFGSSLMERKSQDITALKAESQALEVQQQSLVQAQKDIEQYESLEQIAQTIVPQEKDQARAIREIIKLAEENNIPISNIIFPASNLGQAKTKPNTSAQKPTGNSSTATLPTSQVSAVEGIPGVFQFEINLQSATPSPVPYENLLAFLKALEQNRRTAHITNLSITPFSDNRNLVTFSLTVVAYMKP
jgi:hypothetical protein